MTNQKANRISRLLITLQTSKKISVTELMKLNECSKSTVLRDIKELKTRGVDLEFDNQRSVYILNKPQELYPPQFTYLEAIVLLLLVQKAKCQILVPCYRSLELAAMKVEELLSPPVRQYCKEVLPNISFSTGTQLMPESVSVIFSSIIKAIHQRCVVKFSYNIGRNLKTDIVLEPYRLHYNGTSWYLIGKYYNHHKINHFTISSINNLAIHDVMFEIDTIFDIQNYCASI